MLLKIAGKIVARPIRRRIAAFQLATIHPRNSRPATARDRPDARQFGFDGTTVWPPSELSPTIADRFRSTPTRTSPATSSA
jgi:hypothetical protein